MQDSGPYRFQHSFADSSVRDRVLALLDLVFGGMKQAVLDGVALGAPWDKTYTPFVRFEGDRAVAHVGVLELPMVLLGRDTTIAGIHAVCTHPEFRGRGYFREVMHEALDYCSSSFGAVTLFTGKTALYEPFGFRTVQEHVFRVRPSGHAGKPGFRLLNTAQAEDRRRLHDLLAARTPVSGVLGIRDRAIFCVNEANRPLYYADELEALVSMEVDGKQLRLFDVVSRESIPLVTILECMDRPFEEVVIHFSPDRLHPQARPEPCVLRSTPQALGGSFDSYLMVRGEFPPESRAFMFPPSARS